MTKGSVSKMLGEDKYQLFLEGKFKLIAEIDRQSMVIGQRFKLRQIIISLDLPFKNDGYILSCYETTGRYHLLDLVKDGVIEVDKSKTPYSYYRTPNCKPNPRLGPDIDYVWFFKQIAPTVREACERKVKDSEEGTKFLIPNLVRSLDLPYAEVPAIKRRYIGLILNILRKLIKLGYLTATTKPTRPRTIFWRTNLYN